MRLVSQENKIRRLPHIGSSYVSTIKTIALPLKKRKRDEEEMVDRQDSERGEDGILWGIPGAETSSDSHKKTRRP